MVKAISTNDIRTLLQLIGTSAFISRLVEQLKADFSRWEAFQKRPRVANHYEHGVIELMPISDDRRYAVKYVNGHPKNPQDGYQTVVAMGLLADVGTGYPLMVSEMSLLTALRTAATSVLASSLMARKNATKLALIGTGAQSEFQALAHVDLLGIDTIYFYDTDPGAMKKFESNMLDLNVHLMPCDSVAQAAVEADIIITCTACKDHVIVLPDDYVKPGVHINGLGGDCPGKTELDEASLHRAKVVVEFFEQSFIEGEIQHLSENRAKQVVHAHLYELIRGTKSGRSSDQDITIFDSVGFALEDYSVLNMVYSLAEQEGIGINQGFIPPISDPKNLYGYLTAVPLQLTQTVSQAQVISKEPKK